MRFRSISWCSRARFLFIVQDIPLGIASIPVTLYTDVKMSHDEVYLRPTDMLHPDHSALTLKHLVGKGLAKMQPKETTRTGEGKATEKRAETFRLNDFQHAPTWGEATARASQAVEVIKHQEKQTQAQLALSDATGSSDGGQAAAQAVHRAALMASLMSQSRL